MASYSLRQTPKGWCGDARINGRRRQLYAPTRGEAEARILAAIREAEAQVVAPAAPFTLREGARLSQRIRWKDSAWARTAAIYARQAIEWFGPERPLEELNAAAIEAWRQELLRSNAPATVNRKVSVLRAVLADAVLHGHIGRAPAVPRQLAERNLRDRIVDPLEERAILAHLEAVGESRAADLVAFLLETGCRWSEAERLAGLDVDLRRMEVRFPITKSGRPRTVKLTTRAAQALEPWLPGVRRYRVWGIPYQQFRRTLNRTLEALAIEGVTIHSLRHTCLSRLAQAGVPLPQLMAWSGHSSLAACSRYLHLDTARLDQCVAALEQASIRCVRDPLSKVADRLPGMAD